jgi:hypothetical protein
VPKAIVRRSPSYNLDDYYRNYLISEMKKEELSANSSLVRIIKKTGERKVAKVDLEIKYGSKKVDIIRETINRPDVLQQYKDDMANTPFLPLEHESIAAAEGTAKPKWSELLSDVVTLPTGTASANQYENKIESLLAALLYPDLSNPIAQWPIHSGRKRIDITYTNMAISGFFFWLSRHYSSGMIFVECKNYQSEIGNPEIDQLTGRFSASRGMVGILVCRKFDNKNLFLDRCRDTARDGRGFVLAIDDQDLREMVEFRKAIERYQSWPLLDARFKALIA